MTINLKVNGENIKVEVKEDEYLSETLRNNGYKSVKRGCDKSTCGACTVLVDKEPVLSCSYFSHRAEGKSIITLEGVQAEAEKLGEHIVNEGADQCGFCTPSLALTTIAMKNELENPTEEDIKHYINGNLCRCTGYEAQMKGIKKYLGVE